MEYKSISVFLPALNEQENIQTSVLSVKKYLEKRFKDYEILVVANGSTDDTERIVAGFAKKDRHIKIVNETRRGYGQALRSGFKHSSKDLVFYTDGDMQFAIEDLDKLLPFLNKYDVVSGFRLKRQDSFMRVFAADTYNLLIRLLFNLRVRDIDASFKLFKRIVLKKITLKSNTGFIDAEALIKAKKYGFSIGQVAVNHYPRLKGQSAYAMGTKIAIVKPKVIIDILKEIKTLWPELR